MAAHEVFENYSHAGHDFEIADDGIADALADGFGFGNKRLHHLQDFRAEIGIINGNAQVIVAAFAHQIADSFVHSDAGRSDETGHASDDAVVARGNHV